MKNKRCLAVAFLAATLFAPMTASALSVNDFEKQTAQQQAASYTAIVTEAIHEAFAVDNKTGVAVGTYFTAIPKGAVLPEGATAFEAELQGALQDAKDNKVDLDKLQIEMIIADVVQTYVLPNIAQNPPAPAPKGP